MNKKTRNMIDTTVQPELSSFFLFRIRYDDDVEVIPHPIPINITSKSFTETT